MKSLAQIPTILLFLCLVIMFSTCGKPLQQTPDSVPNAVNLRRENAVNLGVTPILTPTPAASKQPNLQSEILDDRNKTSDSPISKFDFKNYEYPLPHGWKDADGKDVVLENGLRRMSETEKKIGVSYVTTKFFDVTGDNQDEAIVVLKIDTAGSAIPQIVYIFTLKNEQPELIWYFRTGDRSDGGLKDFRAESGELIVELFGQDRFLFGAVETSKITNDLEQICCPTFYTRTAYKWNGSVFRMDGKRLTFSTAAKNAAPVENMGDIIEQESRKGRRK